MKRKILNSFEMIIPALSENERFARQAVSAFAAAMDPTVEELADLRTAVSEAVTNCIVHAYKNPAWQADEKARRKALVYISAKRSEDRTLTLRIRDKGCGMEDVERCRTPLYTTDESGERGGMGFAIMECFTDTVRVLSKPGKGTTVTLVKKFSE